MWLLLEEVEEASEGFFGRFLRYEVARGQSLAAHLLRPLPPDAEHVVGPPDEALGAPKRQKRAVDPPIQILLVVSEVDRGRGAIVLAGGMDRRRIGDRGSWRLHPGGERRVRPSAPASAS